MFGVDKIARKIVDGLMSRSAEWAAFAERQDEERPVAIRAKAIAVTLEVVATVIADAAEIPLQ